MKYAATSITTALIVLGGVFAVQAINEGKSNIAVDSSVNAAPEATGATVTQAEASTAAPKAQQASAAVPQTRVVCTKTVGDDEDDGEGDDEDDSKVTCVTETVPGTAAQSQTAASPKPAAQTAPAQAQPKPVPAPAPAPAAKSYTLAEVKAHSTASSCWMAVSGKVYDATSYISSHPGGSQILMGCGKDATSLFGAQHAGSNRAASDLAGLYIGTLQ